MNYKILITSIFAGGLIVILLSLGAGIAMREVTVVEHPYEDGLKFDALRKRQTDLGWKVVAPLSLKNKEQLNVGIFDKDGVPLNGASVEFAVNRMGSPTSKKYRAAQADHGGFGAPVEFSSHGYWEVRVNVTRGDETLSYDRRIQIEG